MKRHATRAAVLPATLILAACATPQTMRVAVSDAATREEAARQMDIAAQDLVDEQKRLERVFRQLATRAHALCGEHVGPNIGAHLMRRPKGGLGDALARLYGVEEKPTVLFVLEDGPAAKAGLQPRDVVLQINGVSTGDKNAYAKLADQLPADAPIVVDVERAGAPLSVTLQPERACRYAVQLAPQQDINAFADGNNVMVARGMMNFARDDNELALVLSHEMAHNTMRHIDAKKRNMGLGLLADIAVAVLTRGQAVNTNFAQLGATSYSQEFEAEADYVGLYIMANAGFPIADAPKFWRRMAAAHPANIQTNHAASHPSTSYRMVALEETVKEIGDKLAHNEPLVPNMKHGSPAAPASP